MFFDHHPHTVVIDRNYSNIVLMQSEPLPMLLPSSPVVVVVVATTTTTAAAATFAMRF